jgi:3',5'-cyclic AMP phosphodiesterase CpdA
VVPGNHDVPLWDVVSRIFSPLIRYQRFITRDLSPCFQDEELFVFGVNTARSFTRTSGWITEGQLDDVRRRVCSLPDTLFKVVVTHHPFIPAPRKPDSDVVRGAPRALDRLEKCGVDMLLAGHLHLAYHDDVRAHHKATKRSILSIQAGTATSTRRRNEPNAYNWITVSQDLVTVAVRAWNGRRFEESLVTRYERVEHEWRRAAQVPVDEAAARALQAPPV